MEAFDMALEEVFVACSYFHKGHSAAMKDAMWRAPFSASFAIVAYEEADSQRQGRKGLAPRLESFE